MLRQKRQGRHVCSDWPEKEGACARFERCFVPDGHGRFMALWRLIFDAYLQKMPAKKRMTKKRYPLLTISPRLAYNIYRRNDRIAHGAKQKPPELQLRGLSVVPFYPACLSFCGRVYNKTVRGHQYTFGKHRQRK